MSQIVKRNKYQPFRDDLPLVLYTWLFFAMTLLGFVLISVAIGAGALKGILSGLVISMASQTAWRSSAAAMFWKKFLTKSLFGFVVDIIRKRSFYKALKEMYNADMDIKAEAKEIVQHESRWLIFIPAQFLVGTLILDWLIDASLTYYLIAGSYFLIVGLAWMLMCRKGRLIMLPIEISEG